MRSLIVILSSIVLSVLITGVITERAAFAGVVTPASREILDEAKRLTRTESRKDAHARLEKISRAQLVLALREGLAIGETIVVANAATELRVSELTPDLIKLEDPNAVLSVRVIAPEKERTHIAAALLKRAKTSGEFPYRNEVYRTLGAWKIALGDKDWADGLKDPQLEVRDAVVQNFLSARSSLPLEKQITRFSEAFAVKPSQTRERAMDDFAGLPANERTKLHGVLSEDFQRQCQAEANADVKAACEKVLKGGA